MVLLIILALIYCRYSRKLKENKQTYQIAIYIKVSSKTRQNDRIDLSEVIIDSQSHNSLIKPNNSSGIFIVRKTLYMDEIFDRQINSSKFNTKIFTNLDCKKIKKLRLRKLKIILPPTDSSKTQNIQRNEENESL